ncbi:MAG: copper resistance system multicopper oxidase [Sphingomonas sanxanigenens]|uniref:Copper resistance system multicopper oxidase n=1 Tax=Sphingomonas sanxanigenens TaxID=397260 RepID=A0A2W5A6B1_9SPHN|nr:MAG: copper resistance system multicopper oxidase [Sphingomonas sanxanigenens]
MIQDYSRRDVLRGVALAGGGIALAPWLPGWAQPVSAGIATPDMPALSGEEIRLKIARQALVVDGRATRAIGINGTVPGPLIRLREGQDVKLVVENGLDEDSSVHWHGLILPAQFDGVPGVSFPGIAPRSSFTYQFPIRQSGTYWYHSHSGLQEQAGHYGPIVIDPAGADPIAADREHVVVLSDHSRMSPEAIFRKLKAQPGYFNYQRQTLAGLIAGRDQKAGERIDWGAMRMDPADISDVTGSTYTYLVNGYGPKDNWTALFAPGERVRLRFINASSMTSFNVRIPGLALTVVQADGQNIRPVETDEFQIAVAETYDVIVTPAADRAYTIVGEAIDRSGVARATLALRAGMMAEVPPLRPRPLATMKDMGMGGMDHGAMGHGAAQMDMGGGSMGMRDFANAPQVERTPGVQTISPMPMDRTGEPGQGLADVGHRVLVYRDLVALEANPDTRPPGRHIDIHLTGNMERFMWSFDGVKMSDHMEPIPFTLGERVRVNLINDSMMGHPIHLHGHFFELATGHGDHAPRKHTVMVQPGGKVSWDFTADAVGDWAFHCHLLYHMHAGMMRVVSVRPKGEGA